MSRWEAARRGAVTAVLGAVVFFMLLACISEVVGRRGKGSTVEGVAQGLVEVMSKSGPAFIAGAFLLSSALAGMVTDLLARRLRLRPILRSLILALATLPALSLGLTRMWAVVLSKEVLPDSKYILWMPVGAGGFITLLIIELAPVC